MTKVGLPKSKFRLASSNSGTVKNKSGDCNQRAGIFAQKNVRCGNAFRRMHRAGSVNLANSAALLIWNRKNNSKSSHLSLRKWKPIQKNPEIRFATARILN